MGCDWLIKKFYIELNLTFMVAWVGRREKRRRLCLILDKTKKVRQVWNVNSYKNIVDMIWRTKLSQFWFEYFAFSY